MRKEFLGVLVDFFLQTTYMCAHFQKALRCREGLRDGGRLLTPDAKIAGGYKFDVSVCLSV